MQYMYITGTLLPKQPTNAYLHVHYTYEAQASTWHRRKLENKIDPD